MSLVEQAAPPGQAARIRVSTQEIAIDLVDKFLACGAEEFALLQLFQPWPETVMLLQPSDTPITNGAEHGRLSVEELAHHTPLSGEITDFGLLAV